MPAVLVRWGDDIRHFARWDGAEWIALGNVFSTAGNTLVADGAGHLYTEILTDYGQGRVTAIMMWSDDKWEDITGNFSMVVDALKAGFVSSNIPVLALAMDGDNNLYAVGAFIIQARTTPTKSLWAMWQSGIRKPGQRWARGLIR